MFDLASPSLPTSLICYKLLKRKEIKRFIFKIMYMHIAYFATK